MRTKKKAHAKEHQLRRHFKTRLMQRYSIKATRQVVTSIVRQIQDPTCKTFVERQSNTRSLHRVTIDNKVVLVGYSHRYKTPSTALLEGEAAERLGYER